MPALALAAGGTGPRTLLVAAAGVILLTAAADGAPRKGRPADKPADRTVRAPFPPARPAGLGTGLQPEPLKPEEPAIAAPSVPACQKAFEALGGEVLPGAPAETSGACAVAEPITFQRVRLPDGKAVALESPVTLRCTMALELARWIREDLAPAAARQGSDLARLAGVGGQACRSRNRQPGGQISEHAGGNAFDLQALVLADRKVIRLVGTESETKGLREAVRASACARFRTVLGPGADTFHGDHLHVDMRQRKRDFKLCQWEVK